LDLKFIKLPADRRRPHNTFIPCPSKDPMSGAEKRQRLHRQRKKALLVCQLYNPKISVPVIASYISVLGTALSGDYKTAVGQLHYPSGIVPVAAAVGS
jgi:hypothetical protein